MLRWRVSKSYGLDIKVQDIDSQSDAVAEQIGSGKCVIFKGRDLMGRPIISVQVRRHIPSVSKVFSLPSAQNKSLIFLVSKTLPFPFFTVAHPLFCFPSPAWKLLPPQHSLYLYPCIFLHSIFILYTCICLLVRSFFSKPSDKSSTLDQKQTPDELTRFGVHILKSAEKLLEEGPELKEEDQQFCIIFDLQVTWS